MKMTLSERWHLFHRSVAIAIGRLRGHKYVSESEYWGELERYQARLRIWEAEGERLTQALYASPGWEALDRAEKFALLFQIDQRPKPRHPFQ